VITVRDHGRGIPEAELPRVFERFYRATTARGLPGSGLGLAIVRKVADDHDWTVGVVNAPGGGALFSIDTSVEPPEGLTDRDDPEPVGTRRGGALQPIRTWGAAVAAGGLVVMAAALVVALDRRIPDQSQSPQLVTVTGDLTECRGQYCLAGDVVDFGPSWYVAEVVSPHDYDGDGRVTLLQDELAGLVGDRVRLETDGGELDQDVYSINGIPFRDDHGQLPEPPEAVAE
jgi:hypothetical protein